MMDSRSRARRPDGRRGPARRDLPLPVARPGQPRAAGGRHRLALPLPVRSLSLLAAHDAGTTRTVEVFQYFKILYIVALCVAAIRMDRDVSLVKPLAVTAIAAIPVVALLGLIRRPRTRTFFYAIHMGLLGDRLAPRRGLHLPEPARRVSGASSPGPSPWSPRCVELVYVLLFVVAAQSLRRRGRLQTPRLHRVPRRPARDALRHRPDHLGDGGHRAAAGRAPRAHGRRHAPLAAPRVARPADRDAQPVLPRRGAARARGERAGRLDRADRRRRLEADQRRGGPRGGGQGDLDGGDRRSRSSSAATTT